jgi:hypothetical protein
MPMLGQLSLGLQNPGGDDEARDFGSAFVGFGDAGVAIPEKSPTQRSATPKRAALKRGAYICGRCRPKGTALRKAGGLPASRVVSDLEWRLAGGPAAVYEDGVAGDPSLPKNKRAV